MPAKFETVGVKCPRCEIHVACTLESHPGIKTVPDLAERFAEHYSHAHPAQLAEAMPPYAFAITEADRRIAEMNRRAGETGQAVGQAIARQLAARIANGIAPVWPQLENGNH